MSRKVMAVVSAAISLLIFTVLPIYASSLIPQELEAVLAGTGFNPTGFTNQISMIGIVTAALALVKGFVAAASPLYLVASIASSGVTLALTMVTLSLGEWSNMGITTISTDIEGMMNTTVIDLRLFVQLAVLSVGLQIIHSIWEFMEARKTELSSPRETGTDESIMQLEHDIQAEPPPVAS